MKKQTHIDTEGICYMIAGYAEIIVHEAINMIYIRQDLLTYILQYKQN